jgi:hypothetical protein
MLIDRSGWAACPLELFDTNTCDTNTTWKRAPMKWTTMMSTYKQFTSTTYDRRNFTIVNAKPTGEPEHIHLNSTEYLNIAKKLMLPSVTSNRQANDSIAALTYALTWVHRTYSNTFQGESNTLTTALENFLTIPLQWTVTAFQFANYSTPESLVSVLGDFVLPEDMITKASGGSSSQRLAIKNWTGWTFIAVDAAVLFFVLANIIWMLRPEETLPRTTGVAEIDTYNMSRRVQYVRMDKKTSFRQHYGNGVPTIDLRTSLGSLACSTKNLSSFSLAKEIRHWRVKLWNTESVSIRETV